MFKTKSMNRRSVLKMGAATTVAAPFVIRGAHARQHEESDVIVIGAGLAGLNASLILTELGYSVSLLEGSNRVGGRVNTVIKDGHIMENGASEIGPQYARILDMVDRLDLKLIDEDRDVLPFCSHIKGQLTSSRDWFSSDVNKTIGSERNIAPNDLAAKAIGSLFPLPDVESWLDPAYQAYDVSFAELFKIAGYSEEALRLASLPAGLADPFNASALAMFQEYAPLILAMREMSQSQDVNFRGLGLGKEKPSGDLHKPKEAGVPIWNIEGGTSRIPEGMAGLLPRPVHHNKLAMRIDMDDTGVDVYCIDGSHFRAKCIISAIPFHLLRLIDVNPDFQGKHLDAVANLGHINTARAYLKFKGPFWEEDGFEPSMYTDTGLGALWAIDNHKGFGEYRGMLVLTGFAANRVDAIPSEEIPAFIIDELARIRPSTKGQVSVLGYKSWAQDPYVRACRHVFRPGQVTAFAKEMILPWKRLHFAGEHTRRLEVGMEAAMESGERAAMEVLEVLS